MQFCHLIDFVQFWIYFFSLHLPWYVQALFQFVNYVGLGDFRHAVQNVDMEFIYCRDGVSATSYSYSAYYAAYILC